MFDYTSTPVWNPEIVADLIELLVQPDLQWHELEGLLRGERSALMHIHMLRTSRDAFNRPLFLYGKMPVTDWTVDEDARMLLMYRVLPYATLLDNRLTPLAQVRQLQDTGVDPTGFCRWVQAVHPLYRDTARAALQAWTDHYSLLRPTERTPEPPAQLLRAATGSQSDSGKLLRAVHAAHPDTSLEHASDAEAPEQTAATGQSYASAGASYLPLEMTPDADASLIQVSVGENANVSATSAASAPSGTAHKPAWRWPWQRSRTTPTSPTSE